MCHPGRADSGQVDCLTGAPLTSGNRRRVPPRLGMVGRGGAALRRRSVVQRLLSVIVLCLGLALVATTTASADGLSAPKTQAPRGNSGAAHACQHDGWRTLRA